MYIALHTASLIAPISQIGVNYFSGIVQTEKLMFSDYNIIFIVTLYGSVIQAAVESLRQ